jgi:hypothetical protein
METLLLIAVIAGILVQLGFSVVLLRRTKPVSQVDVKAEVADALERLSTGIGQKISISTADMASRLEQLEVSHA